MHPPRALRILLLTCITLVASAAGAAGTALPGPATHRASPVGSAANRPILVGYQEESSPIRLIRQDAGALDTVGVDGTTLTPDAQGIAPPDRLALGQEHAAHRQGLAAVLLVSNWSNAVGAFSEPLAHRLLSRPEAVARTVREISHSVTSEHWNGITLDFESLLPRDTSGLVQLLSALRQALGAGPSLEVDIMNATTASGFGEAGYDLRALAAHADHLVLMAYDQHGPWENTPGPVGALDWVRAGVRAMERAVPADKIILGVAGYGYAWEPHANLQLSVARARALTVASHVTPRFVRSVGEWTATLGDRSVLWWSDSQSLATREALAQLFGLAGVAVWDLALAGPLAARVQPARESSVLLPSVGESSVLTPSVGPIHP